MRTLILAIAGVILLLCFGCGNRTGKDGISKGSYADGIYSNAFFGLTVKLPENWNMQDSQQRDDLLREGGKSWAGTNTTLKEMGKASELQTVWLFCLFKYPRDTTADNLCLSALAENLSKAPEVKTGEDYLLKVRQLFKSGQVAAKFTNDNSNESIGGKDFRVMHLMREVRGRDVFQEYYARVEKGYALTFLLTYMDDAQRQELLKVLHSTSFSEK